MPKSVESLEESTRAIESTQGLNAWNVIVAVSVYAQNDTFAALHRQGLTKAIHLERYICAVSSRVTYASKNMLKR